MKKFLLSLATAFSFVLFLGSCTNEEDINNNGYSDKEKAKIETLMNLFDSYGWELDTTVSIEQRNKELLEMDYEKTKSFLEYMSNGIEFDNFEPTQQSEDNAPKALSNTRSTMTFPIYGSHSSAVASSQTTMILSYDGPKPSSVTIQSTSVSSNPATTWTPDEYGSFNFSGNKCDNIKATGMIKYGSIYKHKYEFSFCFPAVQSPPIRFSGDFRHFQGFPYLFPPSWLLRPLCALYRLPRASILETQFLPQAAGLLWGWCPFSFGGCTVPAYRCSPPSLGLRMFP